MTTRILLAGFGGQGLLFAGKFFATKALNEGKELSWLPSYGPEMRGGTATCSVIISDEPIGSPIISEPDILVAMNLPSLDKFEPTVAKGGRIFVDTTMISRNVIRDDVEAIYIPATGIAIDIGAPTLANMVISGRVLKACPELGTEGIEEALKKVVSAKRPEMLELNLKALRKGME